MLFFAFFSIFAFLVINKSFGSFVRSYKQFSLFLRLCKKMGSEFSSFRLKTLWILSHISRLSFVNDSKNCRIPMKYPVKHRPTFRTKWSCDHTMWDKIPPHSPWRTAAKIASSKNSSSDNAKLDTYMCLNFAHHSPHKMTSIRNAKTKRHTSKKRISYVG